MISPTLDHRNGIEVRKNSTNGLQSPSDQQGLLHKAEELVKGMAGLEEIIFL